jgi:hypothetical protein
VKRVVPFLLTSKICEAPDDVASTATVAALMTHANGTLKRNLSVPTAFTALLLSINVDTGTFPNIISPLNEVWLIRTIRLYH